MGGASDYNLMMEVWPRDVKLQLNSLCSTWQDLEESIQHGKIKVLLKDGAPDSENTFRKRLKAESNKRVKNGGALRWQVVADDNLNILLQLQSLPTPAAVALSKPVITADNVAINVVKSWKLELDQFSYESGLYGPIPVFFGDDANELNETLSVMKYKLFAQLNKFNLRLV